MLRRTWSRKTRSAESSSMKPLTLYCHHLHTRLRVPGGRDWLIFTSVPSAAPSPGLAQGWVLSEWSLLPFVCHFSSLSQTSSSLVLASWQLCTELQTDPSVDGESSKAPKPSHRSGCAGAPSLDWPSTPGTVGPHAGHSSGKQRLQTNMLTRDPKRAPSPPCTSVFKNRSKVRCLIVPSVLYQAQHSEEAPTFGQLM